MKRIYSLLPKDVATKLRNIVEFDGGVADTILKRGSTAANPHYGPVYRPSPGSMPPGRIPSGPLERTYDIKYYPRDVRRGPPAFSRPVEASFTLAEHFRALTPPEPALPAAIDVPVAKPIDGSMKNPDVAKYDPTGLRVTMTANEAAYLRELAKHRANHLPSPSWARSKAGAQWAALNEARGLPPTPGVPKLKRLSPWQYTHDTQW